MLETYLGVSEREPQPLPYDEARAQEVVGNCTNEVMTLTIDSDGAGLRFDCLIKPEIRAAAETEIPSDYPPAGCSTGLRPPRCNIHLPGGITRRFPLYIK